MKSKGDQVLLDVTDAGEIHWQWISEESLQEYIALTKKLINTGNKKRLISKFMSLSRNSQINKSTYNE